MSSLNSRTGPDRSEQPIGLGGKARSWAISSRWVSAAVGLLIAVAGFLFHLSLELRMERLGVFDQFNVMFEADPNEVLFYLAEGVPIATARPEWDHRGGLIHPNLRSYFSIPIRVFAKVLSLISPVVLGSAYLRRQLALLVAPVSAALFYLLFHRLLLRLKFSLPLASLFTLLALVSFSQMVFGSIPESFAISNLAIALAYLSFVISRGRHDRTTFVVWAAVGIFATGITITNIVPVIILLGLSEMYNRSSLTVSVARALKMAVLIVALTLTLHVIGNSVAGVEPPSLLEQAGWIQFFSATNAHTVSERLFTFPALLVDSIMASVPKQQPNDFALWMDPEARYPFQFTFDDDGYGGSTTPLLSPRNWAGIALCLLLLLPIGASLIGLLQDLYQRRTSYRFPVTVAQTIIVLGGAVLMSVAFLADWVGLGNDPGFGTQQLLFFSAGFLLVLSGLLLPRVKHVWRVDHPDRSLLLLSWGSLLIIGFNWGLHSVWGLDRFLYSQHWQLPLVFLLAAVASTQLHSDRVRIAVVAASVVLVAANNLLVVHSMFQVLRAI